MSTLYPQVYSYENLVLAYKKARKHKTLKPYVIEFEKDLVNNLLKLQVELMLYSYRPEPLTNFIIHDPKTRKISMSTFRDRIVHHALYNIISTIFEKSFIYDSYANRIGKGVLKAIDKFKKFSLKATHNYTRNAFVLKADIKHYFETVDHNKLIHIIRKKINDNGVLWLIKIILSNHKADMAGKGMPLGNLTSQFFANVYLNEFDQFIKHKLKAKYYVRYVDDFVIIDNNPVKLAELKTKIELFLKDVLLIELHQNKSKIFSLYNGVEFLGFKIFPHHAKIKRKNLDKFKRKLECLVLQYDIGTENYDRIYDFMEGWIAYTKHANAYKLRKRILMAFEDKFKHEVSSKEVNRLLPKRQKRKNKLSKCL